MGGGSAGRGRPWQEGGGYRRICTQKKRTFARAAHGDRAMIVTRVQLVEPLALAEISAADDAPAVRHTALQATIKIEDTYTDWEWYRIVKRWAAMQRPPA